MKSTEIDSRKGSLFYPEELKFGEVIPIKIQKVFP
jgi:hypothetical protein